jgi:putative methionine-R-sulfoxide reductase with GAF domain
VGTLDVESEEVDAFSEEDRGAAMERCVMVVAALFEE